MDPLLELVLVDVVDVDGLVELPRVVGEAPGCCQIRHGYEVACFSSVEGFKIDVLDFVVSLSQMGCGSCPPSAITLWAFPAEMLCTATGIAFHGFPISVLWVSLASLTFT